MYDYTNFFAQGYLDTLLEDHFPPVEERFIETLTGMLTPEITLHLDSVGGKKEMHLCIGDGKLGFPEHGLLIGSFSYRGSGTATVYRGLFPRAKNYFTGSRPSGLEEVSYCLTADFAVSSGHAKLPGGLTGFFDPSTQRTLGSLTAGFAHTMLARTPPSCPIDRDVYKDVVVVPSRLNQRVVGVIRSSEESIPYYSGMEAREGKIYAVQNVPLKGIL